MTLPIVFDAAPAAPPPAPRDAAGSLALLLEREAGSLRLVFSDILGALRTVEVPPRQFAAAFAGEILLDGSAVGGVPGTEEPVMCLVPDPATLCVLPWREAGRRPAAVACDVRRADGAAFEGDPRGALRRVLTEMSEAGYDPHVGLEVEFFLFEADRGPAEISDRAGYHELVPGSRGEAARGTAVDALEAMGIQVEHAHHERAADQHEITLAPTPALHAADRLLLLQHVVRTAAAAFDLRASFLPKPTTGRSGSGLHAHHQLRRGGENAFHDPEAPDGLSSVLRHFVGGLLRHARGFCAVTNPLVNSYKRLVPGHGAPVGTAWSLYNRSLLVRVPAPWGERTRCELRLPDPAGNPYLSLAAQLAAGLDGILTEAEPGDPISKNVPAITPRERSRLRIDPLPTNLGEALDALERDRVIRGALGETVYAHLTQARRAEWADYSAEVHAWELHRYHGI